VIPSKRAHLFVAATTHPGMSGKNNEDRYSVSAHQISETDPTPSLLALVCDGIGGHRAGEVAAEIAVETISYAVVSSDASNPQSVLSQAIIQASQTIYDQSGDDSAQKGMGSTCACVWVIGNRLYTASVGDSRIYLLRNGIIRQITTDHTWIQEAIEHGIIKPEQARGHPRAHIIRRYLGSKTVEPDFRLRLHPGESDEQALANQGTTLLPGDRLLLCSDGLTDLVEDHEIQAALASKVDESILNWLVDLANERGGHDNITIVAIEIPGAEAVVPKTTSKRKNTWITCLIVAMIVAVFIAAAALLTWYATQPAPSPTPTLTLEMPAIIEPTDIPPSATLTPSDTLTPTDTLTPLPTETPTPETTYTPWPTDTLAPTDTLTPEENEAQDGPSGGSSP
jgi:serine/threonine protein phosphatase PrpC